MFLKKLKIVRYIYWKIRDKRLLKEHYQINLRKGGTEYAEICKEIDLLRSRKAPLPAMQAAIGKKTDYIISVIEKTCADVIDRYLEAESEPKDQMHGGTVSPNIWVFWWTGEETAPELVRACIHSIRLRANGHPVVVLDQNNYQSYVQIPEHILEKHAAGRIGHAHFSDILRLSLLAKYGGAWIDATVFLSQPLPDVVFQNDFYSLRQYDPDATYPSKSRWCTYFLAGNSAFPLFGFVRDCLTEYWKKNNSDIDYLLFDYVILLAYRRLPSVREAVDRLPDNNPYRMELMERISAPYSDKLFTLLSTSDTFASKLSWRYPNLTAVTKAGEETNYGHFLSLYLPER